MSSESVARGLPERSNDVRCVEQATVKRPKSDPDCLICWSRLSYMTCRLSYLVKEEEGRFSGCHLEVEVAEVDEARDLVRERREGVAREVQ